MKVLIALQIISLITCARWLPSVTGYSESDSNNGYAGILGRSIVGVKLSCGNTFRVHLSGKSSWEGETTGTAGDMCTPIDGIAINGKTYKVYAGYWLPSVNGYSTSDSNNGYAGILGRDISGLMISGCTYAVAVSDGTGCGGTPHIDTKTQTFVSTGTGLKGVSYQRDLPGMREGCYFIGSCVIGGLGSDASIMAARSWAVNKGYIRDSDTYCNVDWSTLSQYIANNFGTTRHSNWRLQKGCNHYWVVDQNGKEVFNSAGLGYSGC